MRKLFIIFMVIIFLISCSNGKNKEQAVNNDVTEEPNEQIADETVNEDEVNENVIEVEEIEEQRDVLYEINDKTWSLDPLEESINDQVVLLTIDDAPDKYALQMAQTLKELDVPALFFVNGHFLETDEQKEILKQIDELGFVIGNHTYSHRSLHDLSEAEQLEEIVKVNDQVEAIIGKRPLFFRAPFGQNTDYSRSVIKDEQMVSMNWTYGYDWNKQYMDKESLTHIMVNADELRAGANLLMHDREWTNDALKDIVTGLREKEYEFIDPNTIKTADED